MCMHAYKYWGESYTYPWYGITSGWYQLGKSIFHSGSAISAFASTAYTQYGLYHISEVVVRTKKRQPIGIGFNICLRCCCFVLLYNEWKLLYMLTCILSRLCVFYACRADSTTNPCITASGMTSAHLRISVLLYCQSGRIPTGHPV